MTQHFTIPYRLPSLNDYILANRANKYGGASFKKQVERDIILSIRAARIHPVANQCIVCMTFVEGDKRRDVDNVESAKKYISDSLVRAGILQGDSPKYVIGMPSFTVYDKGARVEVSITESADEELLRTMLRNARAAAIHLPASMKTEIQQD